MHSDVITKVKEDISLSIFLNFLSWSEELYAVQCKVTDDVTTAEPNPVGFQFAILNQFNHWIDYSQFYHLPVLPILNGLLLAIQRLESNKAADIAASWRLLLCVNHIM